MRALCRPRRRFFPAKTPILYVGCFYVVARCAPTEIAVRRHSRAHGRAASARDWKPGKGSAISSFARIEDNYASSGPGADAPPDVFVSLYAQYEHIRHSALRTEVAMPILQAFGPPPAGRRSRPAPAIRPRQ